MEILRKGSPIPPPAGYYINAAGGCSPINKPQTEPYEASDEVTTSFASEPSNADKLIEFLKDNPSPEALAVYAQSLQ